MDVQEIQEAKKKYITYIPIYLTGALNNPDIKFDIIQPDNKAVGTPGYNALEKLRSNDNELISQAGVVLLLGDFKASDGGISNTAINKGALTTVSDVVTNYVSSEITNQFQNLTGLKFLNVNFNYQNRTDVYTDNANNVNQFSATVSLALFKQRVMVDFENSIDVSKSTAGSNSNYAGNFKAQFLITEDGRFRLNTYRISDPNIDGSSNNGITKSGLGLSYRQVFNRFSDLYGGKRKKPKKTEDHEEPKPIRSGVLQ